MLSLIVNPSSGGGRAGRMLSAVSAELARLGLDHVAHTTRSLEHARELARAAAADGSTAVAFGGDGLVGAVAGALADGTGVLGILPGGRGNDLAHVLGIPGEPVAACATLRDGHVRALDIGRIGSATFVGIASCGFDSDANRIANATRLVRGRLVYTYGGVRALLAWRPATFELSVDGEPVELTGYTVAVANSARYGGGMMLAPDARLDDGMLDVVLVSDQPRLRFLRHLPKVFTGEHVGLDAVRVLRARTVSIAADRPFTMYADGDPIGELPLTVTVDPGAVRTMVPAR